MSGIWSALTGSGSSKKESSPSTPAPEPTYTAPVPTAYETPTAPTTSSFLSDSLLLDPAALHPLAGLDKGLDYVSLADDLGFGTASGPVGQRSWSDDLCYGTGTTYLCALTLGGIWGLSEGLKKELPVASGKLRLNTVLNAVTRRGPFLGNSAGVIALVYNGIASTVGAVRGKHDAAGGILSGALAGMLFKSTRGVRPMLIAGGMTAGAAGVWQVVKGAYFVEED
ncbi:Tim17-domain-containing protein [Ascobolus immersus RN42]|uniref:Tim17-domain-containing protein n=1 Tax=Ascobolus immersus RN42 TaxID=1160509 RepID=A0A3N4HQB2_ASCIM|nr:Tim17-domain-containing protein [Ascobolus immersus RN42]